MHTTGLFVGPVSSGGYFFFVDYEIFLFLCPSIASLLDNDSLRLIFVDYHPRESSPRDLGVRSGKTRPPRNGLKKTDFLYFSAPAYLLLFYYLIPVNRFSISRAGVWLRCRLGWFSLPPVEFDNFLPVVDQITFSLPSPDWFAFLSVLDSLLSTVPSSASSISSGNGEFNCRNAAFLHLLLEAHSFLYLFLDCWITSQVTICSGFSSYFFTYPW